MQLETHRSSFKYYGVARDVSCFTCDILFRKTCSYFRGAYYRNYQHICLILNVIRLWETFLLTKLCTEEGLDPKCLLSKFLTVYLCHAVTDFLGSLVFYFRRILYSSIEFWQKMVVLFPGLCYRHSTDTGNNSEKVLSAVYGCLQTLMMYSDYHTRNFYFFCLFLLNSSPCVEFVSVLLFYKRYPLRHTYPA